MLPAIDRRAGNFTEVRLPDQTLWFSYETLVAFQRLDEPAVVRENVWGATTGRHLNSIDGGTPAAKARRVDLATFAIRYMEGL